jgi:cobalt/nickel transport system permease protein
MHIPDGFIDVPVSLAAAGVSTGVLALSLQRTRKTMADATAPMAGLVAVFVFAAQMFNFPVGAGTSGHMVGAALAVILIGPYAGIVAVSVVVFTQALFFADGGLTAIGLNVLNLAILTALVAWPAFRIIVRFFGSGKVAVMLGAGIAGFLSVIAAASGFVLEFGIGGTAAVDTAAVAIAMLSVHTVIGVIEGVITALVVGAILSIRPDLVTGVADLRRSERSQRPAERMVA